MPKKHKYKEKLSIHLLHGHVGIIDGGYSRPLPYGLLWWVGAHLTPGVAGGYSREALRAFWGGVGPFSPSSRLWRQLGATRHNPYGVQ